MKETLNKILKKVLTAFEPQEELNVDIATINGNRLLNKTIVITGGGKSLGFAMAKKCITEGAHVIISGRNERTLQNAVKELGSCCQYIVYDISDVDKSVAFLDECKNKFNKSIDCLICNAGLNNYEPSFINVTVDGFDKLFDVNFRGTYFLSKAYLEMKNADNQSGNLIILSSETGNIYYETPYGMSKAALNDMTRAMAEQGRQIGVRINAIAPGGTVSEMTAWYTKNDDGNLYRKCSSERIFVPEEVAELTCFLASEKSICINGQIIHTNAGNHLRVYWE